MPRNTAANEIGNEFISLHFVGFHFPESFSVNDDVVNTQTWEVLPLKIPIDSLYYNYNNNFKTYKAQISK